MPEKHESSSEGTLASDDGGPLTAQASASTPSLAQGSRPVRAELVRCLPHHGAQFVAAETQRFGGPAAGLGHQLGVGLGERRLGERDERGRHARQHEVRMHESSPKLSEYAISGCVAGAEGPLLKSPAGQWVGLLRR